MMCRFFYQTQLTFLHKKYLIYCIYISMLISENIPFRKLIHWEQKGNFNKGDHWIKKKESIFVCALW